MSTTRLGLKVMTFFNSLGNVDFENYLVFNPSFNIRREKAKIVNTMTCRLTSFLILGGLKAELCLPEHLFSLLTLYYRFCSLKLTKLFIQVT